MLNAVDRYGNRIVSFYDREAEDRVAALNAQNAQADATVSADGADGSVQTAAAGSSKDFFGADGPSFRDVFDAINPLNHIPVVSTLMQEATGHQVSTAAKLVGGALVGGPVGFVVGLIDAIFEQETGKGAVETVFAALTGDSADTTQVAAADEVAQAEQVADANATVTSVPVDAVEEISVADPDKTASLESRNEIVVASLTPPASSVSAKGKMSGAARNAALLELYGNSTPSAHRSYKKAQLLPYLKDVTTSQVL